MEYFIQAILWFLWSFLHSFFIAPSVANYLKRKLNNSYKYFRLFYNIFALVSLAAVWSYADSCQDEIIYSPSGYWQIIQIIILGLSVLLFVVGAKNYDIRQFLGFSQLTQEKLSTGLGQSGSFNQTGILRYTRHPWYLGTILILWSGYTDLSISRLIMNSVFTLYVIVGTLLEEKKLAAEFGDVYREYQKKVPMFISLKSFTK